MTLSEVLTYLGLLIAAYGATQEYIRLKMRLVSKVWLYVFFVSLVVLYLSTLGPLRDELKNGFAIKIFFSDFCWEAKYWIVVTINFLSLFFILKNGKLRKSNQKEFLDLIHEIKSSKNEYLIDKLIYDNADILIKLRFEKSFIHRLRYSSHDMLQNLLNEGTVPLKRRVKKKIKNFIYKILDFCIPKYDSCIGEIFDNTIENKEFIKKLAKSNEQLGIKILKTIVENEAYGLNFSRVFLVEVFKNPRSFIHQNMFEKAGGDIGELLFEYQHFEKLDLGLNICWAILELIEDNPDLMIKNYNEISENEIIKAIRNIMCRLNDINPMQMHLSSLPYHIQKELLKFVKFDSEYDEGVAISLLISFYHALASLQKKIDPKQDRINLLNYLYSTLPDNVEYSPSSMIRLGCAYIEYIFGDFREVSIEEAFEQFKQLFEKWEYSYKNNNYLKKMFLVLLDKGRYRDDCDDWIHYSGNIDNNRIWSEMTKYLEEEKK